MSETPQEKSDVVITSGTGCALRVFWLIIGNAILFFCLVVILNNKFAQISMVDYVFAGTLLAMLLARWIEIVSFKGLTVSCEPATPSHWMSYAIKLILIGSAALFGAHGIATLL